MDLMSDITEKEAYERVIVLLNEARIYTIPAVADAVDDFYCGDASAIETLAALMDFVDNPPPSHYGSRHV